MRSNPSGASAATKIDSAPTSEKEKFLSNAGGIGDRLGAGVAEARALLPRFLLDPCGGNGALRCSLALFGVDVRLSDLYPERYPTSDGYVTSQPLDASEAEPLRYALELAGADCTAIITNTPHNTDEACAIVRSLVLWWRDNTSNLSRRFSSQSGVRSLDGPNRSRPIFRATTPSHSAELTGIFSRNEAFFALSVK